MEAGTSTAPRTDIFDRIGDFVGDRVREGAQRFVDYATVSSPLVAAGRGATDPMGTKKSFARVGRDAFDAISILNPGVGITRLVLGTEAGRKAAAEGAKGAVEAATLTNPLFAAGRAIVDPTGTRESFERGADVARRAADIGFDIATITNPGIAMARGIASIFGD